jgi:hypothetical protein
LRLRSGKRRGPDAGSVQSMRPRSLCKIRPSTRESRWECHNLDQVRVTSLNLLRQIGIGHRRRAARGRRGALRRRSHVPLSFRALLLERPLLRRHLASVLRRLPRSISGRRVSAQCRCEARGSEDRDKLQAAQRPVPVGRASNGAAFCARPASATESAQVRNRDVNDSGPGARVRSRACPTGSFTCRFRVPVQRERRGRLGVGSRAIARLESARDAAVVSSGQRRMTRKECRARIACVARCLRVRWCHVCDGRRWWQGWPVQAVLSAGPSAPAKPGQGHERSRGGCVRRRQATRTGAATRQALPCESSLTPAF